MANTRAAEEDRDPQQGRSPEEPGRRPIEAEGPAEYDLATGGEEAAVMASHGEDETRERGVHEDEVARLMEETRLANERALRCQAELENFRKRMRREMDEGRRYAALPLIADLLAVVDNLERAIEASEKSENANGLLEGVKMVASQFRGILEKHDCRPIEAVGTPFDPHLHEALAQEPSEEYPSGFVTRVFQMGYRLHDRVVRPAQVFVSTGPTATTGSVDPTQNETTTNDDVDPDE